MAVGRSLTISLFARNVPELPKDIKAKIFTQNKGFDPKTFLAHVHPSAGPDDLAYGREKLKGEKAPLDKQCLSMSDVVYF